MILPHLDPLLARYGYGLVGTVVALEAMGLPLPGESMIIGAAIYCATTHGLSIVGVLASGAVGAIMGDNAGYLIGRAIGFRLLARYGRRIGLSEQRLELGRFLFRRYGAVIVFVARFIALFRTFAALLAGANRMPWDRFLFWNALGGIAWVGGYGLAAYSLGHAIERLRGAVALAAAAAAVLVIGTVAILLKRQERILTERAARDIGIPVGGASDRSDTNARL